eukprot:TRINITY_DN4081_c0_g2_i1.p1 TRINITY_DN4081_c0_g2~~TRINITY_DN4081_c0_g2_i1.p1  ORF type:complete len:101 (+),score=34.23 TRINITY_DN4081_c0_g2_i1:80-382(+)
MALRGKASKGVAKKRSGKGKGASKPGAISKGGIRRLARKGGVKRISQPVYEDARGIITGFIDDVMRDTCAVMGMTGRKTVALGDVLYALKKQGRALYGIA